MWVCDNVKLDGFLLAEMSLDQPLLEISKVHFSTLVGVVGPCLIQVVLQKTVSIIVSVGFEALTRSGRASVTHSIESRG